MEPTVYPCCCKFPVSELSGVPRGRCLRVSVTFPKHQRDIADRQQPIELSVCVCVCCGAECKLLFPGGNPFFISVTEHLRQNLSPYITAAAFSVALQTLPFCADIRQQQPVCSCASHHHGAERIRPCQSSSIAFAGRCCPYRFPVHFSSCLPFGIPLFCRCLVLRRTLQPDSLRRGLLNMYRACPYNTVQPADNPTAAAFCAFIPFLLLS